MEHDQLNDTHLRAVLGERPFRYFVQTGSTSDALMDWLKEQPDLPSGAVVFADEQTQGRGRLQRTWHTPPQQALAMSILLRPTLKPDYIQRITMLAGIAVAETLKSYAPEAIELKWPNDVLLNKRKVAGILTEAQWQDQRLDAVILGIGVNIRVDFQDTPLAETAISLESFTTIPVNRLEVIQQILNHLDENYKTVAEPTLLKKWRGLLSTLGQNVHITTQNSMIEGIATDVDDSGALVVVGADGNVQRILVGDVQHRA